MNLPPRRRRVRPRTGRPSTARAFTAGIDAAGLQDQVSALEPTVFVEALHAIAAGQFDLDAL